MKKIVLLTLAMLTLIACKDEKKLRKPEMIAYHEINNEPYKPLYGYWTGYRSDDYESIAEGDTTKVGEEGLTISLKINRIINDKVYGVSIVGGDVKPIEGTCTPGNRKLIFNLREPGTMDDAGLYELQLKNDTLRGYWKPYTGDETRVMVKKIELVQKHFKYSPNYMIDSDTELVDWTEGKQHDTIYKDDEGNEEKVVEEIYRSASDEVFKYNASTQVLTEEMLKNLRKIDLEILRNTVFARHGYSFKRSNLRSFFEMTDWYVPVSNNVDKQLSTLEKKNIALLKRMEAYAEDHYESFGR